MNMKAITFVGALAMLVLPGGTRAASITEPATVFYGQIFGVDSAQPFLVTEGRLEWTFQRTDGTEVVLRTFLEPLNEGEFSYRLDVPHAALILDLTPPLPTLPLGPEVETITNSRIEVNGLPARILGPDGGTFNVSQAYRAATYRLDLEVDLAPLDSDGDGLPDWWEEAFGLDMHDPSDASGDRDGDGISALAEFRDGSDPNEDTRKPRLLTHSLVAYEEGTTGVLLEVEDSDSRADQLVYTINAAPEGGVLYLRNVWENPSTPDRALEVGSTFTQQDVHDGRLVLNHDGNSAPTSELALRLRDEDPEHEPFDAQVEVRYYAPDPALLEGISEEEQLQMAYGSDLPAGMNSSERLLLQNYLLSRLAGHVIWNGADARQAVDVAAPSAGAEADDYITRFGADLPHTLLGGNAADRLTGGLEADLLAGGAGDDRMQGNRGADRFIIAGPDAGTDTIVDFHPEENDVLDLSGLFEGDSQFLADYLKPQSGESGVRLAIDTNGDGSGFVDAAVILEGWSVEEVDLHRWVEAGNLISGGLQLIPVVNLAVATPTASENGPVAGEFVVTRTGPKDNELTIQLAIAGSASNGVDYATLSPQVVFPAGQNRLVLSILPYPDSLAETSESVELLIQPGTGYEIGGNTPVAITIEDLAPQLALEVLDSLAERNTGKAGALLVRRSGVLDRSVLVRLDIDGTAVNGIDYNSVPNFLNLLPGQTTALIEVKPKPTPENEGLSQSVRVALLPDEAYRCLERTAAQIWIADQGESLAQWRSRYAVTGPTDLTEFAVAKPAGSALTYLELYAFGIDPEDHQANPPGLPSYRIAEGHFTVSFKHPATVVGVEYRVEVSGDLGAWNSGPGQVEEWRPEATPENAETLHYRAVRPVDEGRMLFMRVRPTLLP